MKTQLTLPEFNEISPETAHKFNQCIEKNKKNVLQITEASSPSWQTTLQLLEDQQDELQHIWSPMHHLHAVMNNPAHRETYEACLNKLVEYQTDVGQNKQLYQLIQQLHNHPNFKTLSTAQQKIIEHQLRDFRLSGVSLNTDDQHRYQVIVSRLAELTTQFENNLIDSSKAWHYHTENTADLSGLPLSRIEAAKQTATEKNASGWWFGLDYPTYFDMITFADSRHLRELFYRAYSTRASDQSPEFLSYDNGPLIQEILTLRQEQANLLGFKHYSDLSFATKMADSVNQVSMFLVDLIKKVKPYAEKDLIELKNLFSDLRPWDVAYYSEKIRQEKYNIDEETLRSYFPLPIVISGLFHIVHTLWNIKFVENSSITTWHPDVKYYDLYHEEKIIGGLYCDFFARENKRSGAWMDDAVTRHTYADGTLQLPVAFLVCNFNPATQSTPALLTHDDVITLFHEMGHCLQHLLTKIEYRSVAGINGVAWDAVEFPSQFLEAWAWQKPCLDLISSHYQTGEKLPGSLIDNLIAAKNFQAGLFLLRQLEFALYDLSLHAAEIVPNIAQTQLNEIRKMTSILSIPEYNRFQNSFSHIFAGGYAAGYYSYLWAEVLARDAFSAFKEKGLFDQTLATRFKDTVLGLGGSVNASEVFFQFMQRNPKQDALLNYYGIA